MTPFSTLKTSTHIILQSHVCTICGTPTYQESQLKIHLKTHHLEYVEKHWFGCVACRDFFPTAVELASHRCQAITNQTLQAYQTQVHQHPIVLSRRNNTKVCHICGSPVPNPQWYHNHMHEAHYDFVKVNILTFPKFEFD